MLNSSSYYRRKLVAECNNYFNLLTTYEIKIFDLMIIVSSQRFFLQGISTLPMQWIVKSRKPVSYTKRRTSKTKSINLIWYFLFLMSRLIFCFSLMQSHQELVTQFRSMKSETQIRVFWCLRVIFGFNIKYVIINIPCFTIKE